MNKLLVFSCVLATLSAVSSYNFDDPDFNQVLREDLEYLYETYDSPVTHARNRRDEEAVNPDKCRGRKKKLCCAENVMDAIHDADKDLKKACFKEITGKDKDSKDQQPRSEPDPFRCDRVDKHRKEMTCVSQCVGQKKNLLDEQGNPKEKEFTAFVKDAVAKEPWIQSLQDKIISSCLAEAKNVTAGPVDGEKESCNPAGVKLAHCMFREVQLNCPADQIKDEKSCARLKDRLNRHGDFIPPPPPTEPFLHDE